MSDIQFVNASAIKTLEHYAAALMSGMISLRTLEQFHVIAFTKGLLDEDQAERGKTICWEIRRLVLLYKAQMDDVLEHVDMDEQSIITALAALTCDVKVKKQRKKKVKDETA